MKNILEELYYGHLCPCDRRCTPDSKEQKALDRLCAAGDLLSRRLYGEELRAFLDYEDAQEVITEESSAACFSAGFRLGARFALEVSGYGKDSESCLTEYHRILYRKTRCPVLYCC